MKISKEDYLDATSDYLGWCPNCQAFTTTDVEPDAEFYTCMDCEEEVVMGAENALIDGLIEIDENDEDSGEEEDE